MGSLLIAMLALGFTSVQAETPDQLENQEGACNGNLLTGPQVISFQNGEPVVSNHPIVTFIEGDGIGPEITEATLRVLNSAITKAYGTTRKIEWLEVFAGHKATAKFGTSLPQESIDALRYYGVGIKGPLETAVGEGARSLNVTLRQELDLYSCVRPVKYFENVPSPLKNPSGIDLVVFRENTEDVYAGIEFEAGSDKANTLISTINGWMKAEGKAQSAMIREGSAIGIKPMSEVGTKRHMRRGMKLALHLGKKAVSIVHKGNIMKFTEGAFRRWSYEVAEQEFGAHVYTQRQWERTFKASGKKAADDEMAAAKASGKIIVQDVIADNMLQQLKQRPQSFGVIVSANLNGDYLSDDTAALVGGLGIAPGANIGDQGAIFEATHGTAPDIIGQNKANPSSLILSGVMLLQYLGWEEAATLVSQSLDETFHNRVVTGDFRAMEGAKLVGTKEFADELVRLIQSKP